ncbi:MAG: hypothetical protein V6Z86_06315 [Hyphomicrobiales bacterium]
MTAIRLGPRNSVADIAGIAAGNAKDWTVRSRVTVIAPDEPVAAAVDARGGALKLLIVSAWS